MAEKKVSLELTPAEITVIEHLRQLGYGKLTVTVKDSVPVHLELQKSILIHEERS